MHTLAGFGLAKYGGKTRARDLQKSIEKVVDTNCEIELRQVVCDSTMPAPVEMTSSKKRKSSKNGGAPSSKRRAVAEEDDFAETLSTIQELENQIAESRKYYNNIATLISMLDVEKSAKKPELAVAVSLCRVFSRLIAGGNFTETSRAAENEKIVVAWLKERCLEYQAALMAIMCEANNESKVLEPRRPGV